jgi:hypothetical protein
VASEGLRTTFRRALQIALAKHFKAAGLPIAFEGGVIEGPAGDRDIGCVWFEGKRPQGQDGNNEEAFFQVRVFRLFKQDQGGQSPRDQVNADLERTFEILEDALAANLVRSQLQTNSGLNLTGWGDYFTVTEVVKNDPAQYVQATLTVWARNRTARGG